MRVARSSNIRALRGLLERGGQLVGVGDDRRAGAQWRGEVLPGRTVQKVDVPGEAATVDVVAKPVAGDLPRIPELGDVGIGKDARVDVRLRVPDVVVDPDGVH